MIKYQKIIKYIAIALAIFLIVSIANITIKGISTFFGNNNEQTSLKKLEISNNTKEIELEVAAVNVIIREGSKFKIETDNQYVSSTQNGKKLYIKEKSHNYIKTRHDRQLIIYIKEDYKFDNIKLNSGAGKITIENLNTNNLYLKIGAGKVDINSLNVSNNTEITGGVGSFYLREGNLSNLNLDCGVGKIDITARLEGENQIEGGIGTLKINLLGDKESYKIDAEKGLGSLTINDDKIKERSTYGEGENFIKIKSGIGSTKIYFDS